MWGLMWYSIVDGRIIVRVHLSITIIAGLMLYINLDFKIFRRPINYRNVISRSDEC